MTFQVGDHAIVTGDTRDEEHEFKVGTEVIIMMANGAKPGTNWFCWDPNFSREESPCEGNWWIHSDDLELIAPPTEEELAAVYRSLGVTINED